MRDIVADKMPRCLKQQHVVAWVSRRLGEFVFYLRSPDLRMEKILYFLEIVSAFEKKFRDGKWVRQLGIAGPVWEQMAPSVVAALRTWAECWIFDAMDGVDTEGIACCIEWARAEADRQEQLVSRYD